MNEICIVLYVNALYSQHLLNNRKEKLRGKQHQFVGFSICEWFVESVCCLLSVWLYHYSSIQQKKNSITGIQVVPL